MQFLSKTMVESSQYNARERQGSALQETMNYTISGSRSAVSNENIHKIQTRKQTGTR